MGYTGYKVIQYIDDNPNSPTYGETWTELVLDTEHCPNGSGDWELVSSNCELSTSGYTGRRVYTYYNNVTNEYSSTTSADSSCKTSSLDEIWTNSGDSYCEQDEDGKYTGYGLQRQVQTNSNLINYMEIRDVRVAKTECLAKLEPEWQDLYKVCHIEQNPGGTLYYDGTADILQIDINPSSESYNQTRTINVPDESCAVIECDSIVEEWKFVDDYCGNQVPANYGLTNLSADTVYHIYQKYQKCIVEGEVVRETPTGVYSAETYQTGVEDCRYRWVDTEETVCVKDFDGKFKATYEGGNTYELACNGNSTLTSGETRPSGYESSEMITAEIGNCVTSIGDLAFANEFNEFSGLTSITMADSVTSIGSGAFWGCSGLTSITISDSVTSIGYSAFGYCSGLTSIDIPSGVTSIGTFAFQHCYSLTSIGTVGSGASVEIPDSITTLGELFAIYCSGLTSITISSGVTSIGDQAFQYCTSLISITCLATTPPTLGRNALVDTNECTIYVPSGSVDAYKTAHYWEGYASRITAIPNS